MITQKQLTLADFFEECKDIYESDRPQFLTLLENHIDLDEIVPISFRRHYYASTGRNRKYPLNATLWVLIIHRLLRRTIIFINRLSLYYLNKNITSNA